MKTINNGMAQKVPTMRWSVDRHTVRYAVPQSVFRQSEFKWRPLDVEGCDAEWQAESLRSWIDQPFGPKTFVVTSHDQLRSEYAAARLVEIHVRAQPHHEVLWFQIYPSALDRYTGSFRNPIPHGASPKTWSRDGDRIPTMVVCTNLSPESTDTQFESVRDLTARYAGVPTVVCGHGMLPHALATNVCASMSHCAYLNPFSEVTNV